MSKKVVIPAAVLAMVLFLYLNTAPNIWFRNKVGSMMIDGRMTQDVWVYHGFGSSVLIVPSPKAKNQGFYVYQKEGDVNIVTRCSSQPNIANKLFAVTSSQWMCHLGRQAIPQSSVSSTSLTFSSNGREYRVFWKAPPR